MSRHVEKASESPDSTLKRLEARIAGRKAAVDTCELFEELRDCTFAESFIDEIRLRSGLADRDRAREYAEHQLRARELQATPIARLGAAVMPFGEHKGKSLDDTPLAYLDWLARSQEEFYKSLRAYLTHPELKSRRRDTGGLVVKRWPSQITSLAHVRGLIATGTKTICLTAPTGGGKSLCIFDMASWGWSTVIYANRSMNVEQFFAGAEKQGIDFGVQVAGYAAENWKEVQVASIQTVHSRWKARKSFPHPAQLVIIDEIHNETGVRVRELMEWHLANGAMAVVVVTATPLGIAHLGIEKLVIAGTTSELRDQGALLPCITYAPDEPDLRAFKKTKAKIMQLRAEAKEAILPVMFGRVWEWVPKLNPDLKPMVGFAEDVQTSRWWASETFNRAKVPAAHIDAQRIWINGETIKSNRENRKMLAKASESGEVKIVWNRFVLREAVDWPWLYHGIFTCKVGSLMAYIQMGGRLLRYHPSMDHVILQDHGGNFWRHDSLNCDREWELGKTEKQMREERYEQYRTKAQREPWTCQHCKAVNRGVECSRCHFVRRGQSRSVIQTDGTLREVNGEIFKPRRHSDRPELEKKWIECVMRCRNSKRPMTMTQARALFVRENNGLYPGPHYPFMPKLAGDWYLPVASVFPKKEKSNAG